MQLNRYVLARVATPDGSKPLLNKALLKKMRDAGCSKIGYGLESITPEIQKEFHKQIPNQYVEELVSEGHKLGILNKGFLIIGDPNFESPDTIRGTLDELKRIRFDEIRTSFLTAFPGSELYRTAKEDGTLLTEDLTRFTTDEPNLKCKNFTPEGLKEARRWLTSGYYGSDEYRDMVSTKISQFPRLELSYKEHQDFLRRVKLI